MMSEVVGFLGIIAAAVFVWAYSRHNALKLRQMQHEERMMAMQKGLELPYREEGLEAVQAPFDGGRRIWFPLTILGLALVSLFGGAGMLLAFQLLDDQEAAGMWGIGLIPILVSIGLFLFWLAAGRELKKLER